MTKNNYQRFDEITHLPLKVFNRVILMQNIYNDFGRESSREYAEMFNDQELRQMQIMHIYIREKGEEEVRKMVTHKLEVVYDAGEDDE